MQMSWLKKFNKCLWNPATPGKCDEHGQRYTVDIPMTGPNGQTATVRTGWIIDSGQSIPRLATTYVL